MAELPDNLIAYGPETNCTLAICPVEASVYQYRPSLAGNACFIAFFGICLILHAILGIMYRSWIYMSVMILGCISEMIGYGGRIILYNDPFSFEGFLLQIICITFAPVFFTAAIYLTLYKSVVHLGPQYARFPAKAYYWVFIPSDIISLVLQAVGGALSSESSGGSGPAVNVSLTGLSFQVFSLCVFIALCLEFAFRYAKARRAQGDREPLTLRFKIFVVFLSAAIILILIRCAYRIDELSEGYSGHLIHNEGLFIALEGVMVLVAAYFLVIAHPGPAFGKSAPARLDAEKGDVESKQVDTEVPKVTS